MKCKRNITRKIIPAVLVLLLGSIIVVCSQGSAQTKTTYKVIEYITETGEGKKKEVTNLFEGERRKIAQITLRENEELGSHSVEEPIVIHCVAGNGELVVGEGSNSEIIELKTGTYVTLEDNVKHNVIAKPSVSILLTRFLGK